MARKVDQVLIVDGRRSLTTLLIQMAPYWRPLASDQDRFDAAYEAFRDLSEGLYDIDTRQYARGVTSDDTPGIMLSDGQTKSCELVHLPRKLAIDDSAWWA